MISARNQLNGKIKSISKGLVNADIVIETDSGLEISSVITLGSCETMGLEIGSPVVAVVKASNVLVAIGKDFTVSSRNKITGKVKTIVKGAVNDEVVIDADNTEIVSIITDASVQRLGLAEGTEVSALIKASNVIIMKS